MKLPLAMRAEFQRHGRQGGRRRAQALSAEARSAIARLAALRRWTRVRFGRARFAELDLPGGGLVDKGLEDLVAGRETPESLLVSLAAPRLRREGVSVPATCFADAELRLYRMLETSEGPLAHARYLARLSQVASFCDACRFARLTGGPDAP